MSQFFVQICFKQYTKTTSYNWWLTSLLLIQITHNFTVYTSNSIESITDYIIIQFCFTESSNKHKILFYDQQLMSLLLIQISHNFAVYACYIFELHYTQFVISSHFISSLLSYHQWLVQAISLKQSTLTIHNLFIHFSHTIMSMSVWKHLAVISIT